MAAVPTSSDRSACVNHLRSYWPRVFRSDAIVADCVKQNQKSVLNFTFLMKIVHNTIA